MDSCTVKDYLKDWLVLRRAAVKQRTFEQYQDACRQIERVIGDRLLRDLTPAACVGVYAEAVSEGKERTAQILHQVLKMALNDAVVFGMLNSSPMAAVKRPRHVVRKVEPFTHAEIAAMLHADSSHAYLWQLLWKSGARRGEVCALKWSDVDFQNQVIHIHSQLVRTRRGVEESSPKSFSGLRSIPIDAACCDLLRQQLRDQVARGRKGDYVISRDGRRPDPRRVNKWLTEAAKAAGVVNAHPHRFRHTFGTDGVSAGVPIRVLQALMGHSEIGVTAKYYAAVRGDAISAASEQMHGYWLSVS